MKKYLVGLSSCILIVFLFVGMSHAGTNKWPVKRGELCWSDGNGGVLELFATNMGKRHYLVHGVYAQSPDDISLVNGNAEIIGRKIMMHVTSSSFDANEVWGALANVELNKRTLNGVVDGLGYSYYKPTGEKGFDYTDEFAITNIPCN